MTELLRAEGVCAGYGEAVVIDGIDLTLRAGESLALLGRNGVGKSTLLMTLMGLTRLRRGSLRWQGRDLSRLAAHQRAAAGLGWVPQERCMFPSLTVEEHLTAVARPGFWNVARVYEIFPRLQERRGNLGNQLSGGEQQMLAISRALMSEPRLLLLDEPSLGLAPLIIAEIFRSIRQLRDSGLTILLVEQMANQALAVADRAYVLETGRVTCQGTGTQLLRDPAVRAAYLGAH